MDYVHWNAATFTGYYVYYSCRRLGKGNVNIFFLVSYILKDKKG